MDQTTMTQLAVLGSSIVLSLAAGFLVGSRRSSRVAASADWRIRLAARDRDLAEAVDRMIEAEIALQEAIRDSAGDAERARLIALSEELADAEDELNRLRALGVDRVPARGDLAHRMETLEAELATLESLRCPDPSAHRRQVGQSDDLTMITGVGEGLARILRDLGYRTFSDVARMTDDDFVAITERGGGLVGAASREAWTRSARRLADTDAA